MSADIRQLPPILDSTVWADVRQHNQYGAQPTLEVEDADGEHWDRESYLQFDLTSVRSASYAELNLRPLQVLHHWDTVWHQLELVDDDWHGLSEGDMTWHNSRQFNLGGPVIAQWSLDGTRIHDPEPVRVDLGAHVQQALDAGRDKISFRIRNAVGQYKFVAYGSREHPTASPKLVIHSTPEPGAPAVVPLVSHLPALAVADRFIVPIDDPSQANVRFEGNVGHNDFHNASNGLPTYELVGEVSAGQLLFQSDGSFTYDGPWQPSDVTFDYEVSLAGETSTAAVVLSFDPPTAMQTIGPGNPAFARSGDWQSTATSTDGGPSQLVSRSSATASYVFPDLTPGHYQIAASWQTAGDLATAATYQIDDGAVHRTTGWVDQTQPVADDLEGFEWLGAPVRVDSGQLTFRWMADDAEPLAAGAIRLIPTAVRSETVSPPANTAPSRYHVRWEDDQGLPGEFNWTGHPVLFQPDPARGRVYAVHPDGSQQVIQTGSGSLSLTIESRHDASQTLADEVQTISINPAAVSVLKAHRSGTTINQLHDARVRIDQLTQSRQQAPGVADLKQRLIEATVHYAAVDYHAVAAQRIAADRGDDAALTGHIVLAVASPTDQDRPGAEFKWLPDNLQLWPVEGFAAETTVLHRLDNLADDVLTPIRAATATQNLPDATQTASVDLSLPAIGMPITVTRSYDSDSERNLGFGPGWSHPDGAYLQRFTNTNDFILHDGDGRQVAYRQQRIGGGRVSFVAAGEPNPLSVIREHRTVGGQWGLYWTLTDRHGNQRVFDDVRPGEHSRLVERSDRNGNRHRLTYHTDGRLHQVLDVSDPQQPTVRLTYEVVGNRIYSVRSDDGQEVTYRYTGDQRRLATVTHHDTDVSTGVRHDYDYGIAGGANNKLVSLSIDGTVQTTHTYSPDGRLRSTTDQAGRTILRRYNEATGTLSLTNAAGVTSEQVYDSQQRLIRSIDPLGLQSEVTYDTAGRPITQSQTGSPTTELKYDLRGNLIEQRRGEVTVRTTYDPIFSVAIRQTRSAGDLSSVMMEQSIDGRGNVVSSTDAAGVRTIATYDARGQVVTRSTQPIAGQEEQPTLVTHLTYNEVGQVMQTAGRSPASPEETAPAATTTSGDRPATASLHYVSSSPADLSELTYLDGVVSRYRERVPYENPTNLALGATATASNEYGQHHVAAAATDGVYGWGSSYVSGDRTASITLDLGQSHQIDRVRLGDDLLRSTQPTFGSRDSNPPVHGPISSSMRSRSSGPRRMGSGLTRGELRGRATRPASMKSIRRPRGPLTPPSEPFAMLRRDTLTNVNNRFIRQIT